MRPRPLPFTWTTCKKINIKSRFETTLPMSLFCINLVGLVLLYVSFKISEGSFKNITRTVRFCRILLEARGTEELILFLSYLHFFLNREQDCGIKTKNNMCYITNIERILKEIWTKFLKNSDKVLKNLRRSSNWFNFCMQI